MLGRTPRTLHTNCVPGFGKVTMPLGLFRTPPLATTQVTPLPEPAGRLSLTVTPLAVPVPLLLTVTVKPIGSPALTVAASAVLLTWMLAGLQVMLAELLSLPSLVVVTLAVLL